MSFLDHLDELRKRIFHALISVIVTFVGAWIFREQIFGFLSAPIKEVVDQLVVLRPTEPFTVYLKVSFAAAIFFAIPYIMFQVWLFIAPGLYRKEKIYALPFLFSSPENQLRHKAPDHYPHQDKPLLSMLNQMQVQNLQLEHSALHRLDL